MRKSVTQKSRREFLSKATMAAAGLAFSGSTLTAGKYRKASRPQEKIRMGFIGLGNRGSQLLRLFMSHTKIIFPVSVPTLL